MMKRFLGESWVRRGAVALASATLLAALVHGCGAPPPAVPPANDCHAPTDNDLGQACSTQNTPSGVWTLENGNPARPRHCCFNP